MVKKLVLIMMMAVMLLFTDTVSAEPRQSNLSDEEWMLGHLSLLTSNEADVLRMYGQPSSKKTYPNNLVSYNYNGTFFVDFLVYENQSRIISIVTTANNGITTPHGIRVGNTLDYLLKTYGQPDRKDNSDGFVRYIFDSNSAEYGFAVKDNVIEIIFLNSTL